MEQMPNKSKLCNGSLCKENEENSNTIGTVESLKLYRNQEMKKTEYFWTTKYLNAHQKNHIKSLDLTFNSKIKYFSTSSHFVM